MKPWMRKLMPFLALFGLVALVFAFIRGRKAGDVLGSIKALFMTTNFWLAAIGLAIVLTTQNPAIALLGLGGLGYVWGTVGASTTGTFSINFVPQFIEFVTATSPSLIQVNVNGDGMVFNLDTNGLAAMTHIRAVQRPTSTFMFQLADGLLNGKNGTVTITTGVSACTVRAWSPIKRGTMYMTYNPAQGLASQAYNLSSFAYAGFPNAATTDQFQIAYNDGSVDNITREEVNTYLGYTQNDTVTTAKYNTDNIRPARIQTLTFTPTASQLFYVMKYQQASGSAINSNPNV